MANNSIFARNAHRANLQRNAFDLSFTSKFTASVGMLLPCFCKEVNPNEHFRINPEMFLRTVPLNSAAYVRLKQYCEFYFVPTRLLWRSFPQFIAGTSNQFSTAISDGSKFSSVPTWDFNTLLRLLSTSGNDACGYPFKYGAVRLLDLLGYGVNVSNVDSLIAANTAKPFAFKVSPFRMLAYQKIYSDFYRNPLYEAIDVENFNVDNTSSSSSIANQTARMMYLRYRDWKKDYFNAVSPQFQGNDFMSASFTPIVFPSAGQDVNANPTSWSNKNDNFQGGLSINQPSGGSSAGITVANLRSAYALDKLYRLMVSAKDGSYSEQMKTRFGVDAPDDDWKSKFIGAIDAPVTIGDVTTTSDTYDETSNSGAIPGTLYGNGWSQSKGSIDFTSKEHGIIMGIFSILPECDYQSDQIDAFNTKLKREDFFVPEFADLGKQPTPIYQFKFSKDTDMSKVLGWNLRYSEYKTSLDMVHGVFNSDDKFQNQSYNAWVAPRNQILSQYSNGATVSFFKALPSVLNQVMVQQYDGTEQTDQFLVNAGFNVQAIRPMSIYGEPSLN